MIRVVFWLSVAIFARFLLDGGSVFAFNVNTVDIKTFSGSSDSFFGFSLAFLTTSRDKWLLVGAPKGQDPLQQNVKSPGVVFRCPLDGNRTNCTQIVIDPTGNGEVDAVYYGNLMSFHQHKTDQFLGFSLTVSPDNQNILACAPRWRDDDGDFLYMFGMCYEVGANFSRNSRLLPMLVDRNRIYDGNTRLLIYASLGFTAQYTKGGHDLVIAAPGLYGWTGGFAIEEGRIHKSEYMPRRSFGPSEPMLIGYSMVTTERLDKTGDTYIVAGAPKQKTFGGVFVYPYKEKRPVTQEILGEQIGSFFGYAVCVVDVNNDNLDDIVIGAPFYSSNRTEEGRVYAWINKGELKFEQQNEILTGLLSSKARFGSAIANIGDFNKDSFNDVAIGAPYEDNGIGALYIYNGYNLGLWHKHTQRIPGSLVNPGIRSFGASFSQYSLSTDGVFAVGAYDANKAVVLRSNPVVLITPRVQVSPTVISNSTTNLTVSVCFKYTNRSRIVNDVIALQYNITVDTLLPAGSTRAYLSPDNTAHVTKTFRVKSTETCDQLQLIAPFQDIMQDVGLEVRYDLSPSAVSSCVQNCPTLEAFNGHRPSSVDSHEYKMTLHYEKLCGSDNKCDPRLTINVKPRLDECNPQIVVGRDTLLTTDVIIDNEGEPAYNIMIHVDVTGNLSTPLRTLTQSGTSIVDCSRRVRNATNNGGNVDSYQCIVRRPYPIGNKVSMKFAVQFPLANHVDDAELTAKFSVMVTNEPKPQATTEMSVPIRRVQNIKIESSSDPDQVAIRTEDSSKASTDIVHKYSIRNLGPSPLKMAEISVHVPMAGAEGEITVKENRVLLTTYDTVPAQVHSCHGKEVVKNPYELTDDRNLTCNTTPCQRYVCQMKTFRRDQFVLVSVRATVKHTIIKRIKDSAGIHLETQVIIPNTTNGTDTSSEASTLFYKTSKVSVVAKTSFPLWQVIVGSIGALIVLIIAGAVMIKVGCFKRSSKADMQKRMSTRMSRMIPPGQLDLPPTTTAS